MLTEEMADRSLEKIMQVAEDEYLKAKTKEERDSAAERYLSLHRIYNDRLKIQNDRMNDESRNQIDAEKLDYEKEHQAGLDIEDKKSKSKDRWIKIGCKAAEIGVMGACVFIQSIIIHNNMIESDPISKGVTKGFVGRLGDYFKG